MSIIILFIVVIGLLGLFQDQARWARKKETLAFRQRLCALGEMWGMTRSQIETAIGPASNTAVTGNLVTCTWFR